MLNGGGPGALLPLPWEASPCECSGDCSSCTANFGLPALRLDAVGAPIRLQETGWGTGAVFVGFPAGRVNSAEAVYSSGAFSPLSAGRGDAFEEDNIAAAGPFGLARTNEGAIGPALLGAAPNLDVDLFVATTLPDDDSTLSGSGKCNMDEETGCNLVRLRLRDFGFGVAAVSFDVIQRMDRFGGRSWPAMSPDGLHLAYTRKGKAPSSTEDTRLYVRNLDSWGLVRVATGDGDPPEPGLGRPKFPSWYGPNFLLWSASQNGGGHESPSYANWAMFGAAIGGAPLQATVPLWLMGPETNHPYRSGIGTSPIRTNFADPDVYQPSSASLFNLSDMRVATHGSRTARAGETRLPKPRVGPAVTTSKTGVVPTEEFELGDGAKNVGAGLWTDGTGRPIQECHHPAWNVSGDEIVCHAHLPDVPFAEDVSAEGPSVKLNYVYSRSAGGWGSPQLPFDPGTPGSLEAALGVAMPAADCRTYSYKQAQFCGSDGFMVLTLFCKGDPPLGRTDGEIVHSRILIVRRRPLRLWDVTGWIEHLHGVPRGTLTSQVGTCGPQA